MGIVVNEKKTDKNGILLTTSGADVQYETSAKSLKTREMKKWLKH
jgi:hypothetical protein